jgi:Leucine-rich repeat (LRR) protein
MSSSNKNGLAEAERRIAEARRTGERVLNLSDLDLKVLPESVCRLAHLRFLYANNNRLTQLPESIGRLLRLRKLSLLGNCLTQLPSCVGHLARLESLRLSHNRLIQLPKWIGQLAQLKKLHLNSNQLVRLPESIGQLVQLEELYLHRNQLIQLPQSTCQLAQLRKLYLYGNEALNIPAEELGPTRREVREKKGSRKPPQEILDYYFRTRIKGKSERGEDKATAVTPQPIKLSSGNINVNVKKICFVVVYFGKWPIWFPAFLHSCKKNPTINWIFFTDCGTPTHHSPNVDFYHKTLPQIGELLRKKIGKDAILESAYKDKVCDYKPVFGILFDDYLNEFDFWGHCDVDIIWGDIRKYTTEDILDKYDIFSTRKGRISGHFSLFRNTLSINQLFRQSSEFAEVMRQVECRAFDEEGMTRLIARLARSGSIRVYWPKFLQNYADPKTDSPSTLPRYINKYFWEKGKLFDCTGETAAEILYLHFMTWKKTLTDCEFSYGADLEKFYISYSRISIQPISPAGGS